MAKAMHTPEPGRDAKPKVLYVAGWGRSGTTILDNLLGQADGFVSTGELHSVWQRGLIEGRACGCGVPVRDCDVWRDAFEKGFGGMDKIDPVDAVRGQANLHTRHAGKVLRAVRSGSVVLRYPYARYLQQIYCGLLESTNADVIVDSSKFPTDAIVAAGLPGFEVYVVHMVRDPRAVAFSWARRKLVQDKVKDGGFLRRVGIIRSTLVWLLYNVVIQRHVKAAVGCDHYKLVRYEEFASEPEKTLDDILRFIKESPSSRPVFHGNQVELKVSHTASGNPGRFRTGLVSIRLDSEWRAAMPSRQKLLVSALTFPMIRKNRDPEALSSEQA